MTSNEIKANIIMHTQQIQDINRSLAKLDDRQVADETAVRILVQARWTLSQEKLGLQEALKDETEAREFEAANAPKMGDWK